MDEFYMLQLQRFLDGEAKDPARYEGFIETEHLAKIFAERREEELKEAWKGFVDLDISHEVRAVRVQVVEVIE